MLLTLFCALTVHSFGQPTSPIPTEELKKLQFMEGKWTADLDAWMGPEKSTMKVKIDSRWAVGGRFLIQDHEYSMGPGLTMNGLNMLTYDPQKKEWVGLWFDSSEANPMRLTGGWKGDTLTLTSGETEVTGMGKVIMRATYTKASSGIDFLLEMKDGEKWNPMMKGTYKKA